MKNFKQKHSKKSKTKIENKFREKKKNINIPLFTKIAMFLPKFTECMWIILFISSTSSHMPRKKVLPCMVLGKKFMTKFFLFWQKSHFFLKNSKIILLISSPKYILLYAKKLSYYLAWFLGKKVHDKVFSFLTKKQIFPQKWWNGEHFYTSPNQKSSANFCH